MRTILTLLFVLCTPAVFAQNIAYFPRVLATSDTATGLALSNPTADPATVTLTFFNSDGITPGSPATVSVGSGGQIARLSTELFPLSQGQRGWARMSSTVPGLAGFYLNGDFVSTTDGGEFAPAARTITFPWIVESGTTSTEITLTNPGDSTVVVTMTLFGSDGRATKTVTQNIAAKAQVFGNIQKLLGVTTPVDVGYLRVDAPDAVFGAEVVRDGTKDIAMLNARADAPARTLVFPHIATGGGYSTALFVQNTSSATQSVTFQFFLESGAPGAADVTISLAPGQLLRQTVQETFGLTNPALQTGWVRALTSTDTLEGFQAFLAITPGGITALPARKTAATRLLQSHIAEQTATTVRNEDLFTGLAVLNPNETTANLTITIVTRDAGVLSDTTVQLQAREKRAFILRELMPEVLGETSGTVWIQSSAPIFALQVFGSWNLGLLSQIPAQSTESIARLATPVSERFALSGKISTSIEAALGGITIDAIGPVSARTVTDYSGAFVVKNLPAGNYTVTPSRSDLAFTPSSASFTVSRNVRSVAFTAIRGTSSPPPTTTGGGTSGGGTSGGGTMPPANLAVTPDDVEVRVTSSIGVGAYQLTVRFNPAILSIVQAGVTAGAKPFDVLTAVSIDNVAGKVTLNSFQTASGPTGTFTVAHLRFSGKVAGTSALTISTAPDDPKPSAFNTNGDELPSATLSLSAISVTAR